MVEFPKLWRGLKRLILTGGAEVTVPVGERAIVSGRAAVEIVGRLIGARGAGGRGRLATATGLATSGVRATTWLTDLDPMLTHAVAQRLPLVAHVYLGSEREHAAYEAAVQAGWTAFHPHNVQEAIDLTLAAHSFAEHALHPALVALDGPEIADAVQNARLPDAELCRRVLGSADDLIAAPTRAQELIFGEERRRLPRFYDLDRPSLHGARAAAVAIASGKVFFEQHVPDQLRAALRCVAEHTERELTHVHATSTDGSQGVIVARGAVVELAEAVANELRVTEKLDYRVVGIRCPAATDAAELATLLDPGGPAIILQPDAAWTASGTSLTSLLPPGVAACTAYHGVHQNALRAADLMECCRQVHHGRRGDVRLGLTFLPDASDFPKREALLQSLRRDYPEIEELGLRADASVDLRGKGATTIAVNRTASVGGEDLAPGIAGVLGGALDLDVRSRMDPSRGYGVTNLDLVTLGAEGLRDPGPDLPVDVLVLLYGSLHPAANLVEGAAVLVPLTESDTIDDLPDPTLRKLRACNAKLFAIRTESHTVPHESPVSEGVLGAVCGVLRDLGRDLKSRRASNIREMMLASLSDEERSERVADFERGSETVQSIDWSGVRHPTNDTTANDEAEDIAVPLSVRHLRSSSGELDSVPRFWDQVGILYRHGLESEISPDPFQATGTLPPLTATLHDLSTRRRTIRVFEPESCTGCGDCWTVCPDSALGPAAFTFEGIVSTGMAVAKDAGVNADSLRPMVGKIAARAKKLVAESGSTTTVGPILTAAFEYVLDKASYPEDRRANLVAAFDAVHAQVLELSMAKAAPFFENGELLTVAVHVEACKACGACTEVCETGAIVGMPQTSERLDSARRNWRLFERLPDASDEMLARVAVDERVGPAASLLLDQRCMFSLSGGDAAEPGSGEKVAAHLALAAAEHHSRPRLQRHLQDVVELERQFADRIRELMAGSLPSEDLSGISAALDDLGGRHVDMASLTAKLESGGARLPVDAALLRTLVRTAKDLGDLRNRLSVGHSGLGRARVGLLVAPGNVSTWAAAFPYNPFPVPVVLDRAGATAELAEGLCRGQMETVLDDVRLLRRARLELANPIEAQRGANNLVNIGWRDLTAEERATCPPLLLVGGEDSLGHRGLSELAQVLSGTLPIKLLVLAGLDLGLQDQSGLGRDGEAPDLPHGDTGLMAMAHRDAFVVQSSIGDVDHLVKGFLGAFEHDGPALVHVHAPSPQRHGFATHLTREQGRRALAAGVLPRFTYDPAAVGLFGLRLNLQDAPDAERTFAEFAASEGRFARQFGILDDAAPDPTELSEYLAIEPGRRSDKTPFVVVGEQRLRVSDEMVAACEDRRHSMQVLQELAGIVTPFTKRVEDEVAARTASDHEQALESLRTEYESKFAALRGELQQEFTVRLRDRLVELAERHRQRTGATS